MHGKDESAGVGEQCVLFYVEADCVTTEETSQVPEDRLRAQITPKRKCSRIKAWLSGGKRNADIRDLNGGN